MARTTAAAVKLIIETDDTISTDLAPFIEVADSIVTDVCTDSSYSDAKLELISRWLSAHFYAIRDPRAKSEKAGPVSVTYKSKVDLGFDVTHYGQMAMRIDSAGNLGAVNERIKKGKSNVVGATWLGTDYDEDTDDE